MIQHRYLITGAGGQLGREWVNKLTLGNQEVYAYASEDLDVSDHEAVKRIVAHVQPSVIIHCAAYTAVDRAESDPDRARLINAIVPGRIAAICASKSIMFVHYSTDYIFGGTKEDIRRYPDGFREEHPANPQNVYGLTKWEGERAVLATGCEHLIVRTSWLCGRFGHNFVKTMLRLAKDREVIRVVDDQVGCPSFTHSLVTNTLALIQAECHGTYHLSSQGKASWAEVAEEIMQQAKAAARIERISTDDYPTAAKRPFYSLLNTAKASSIEGVHIQDWRQELSQLLMTSPDIF